jgi:hypothetical protein
MSIVGTWVMLSCGALLTVAGCTTRLISEYDEATDQAVTQLQAHVASHLATLNQLVDPETAKPKHPDCEFDRFTSTYAQLSADVHVLVVRNEARQKNALTTAQLKVLEDSISSALVTLHRDSDDKCMDAGTIVVAGQMLDQNFGAILKLELAKKLYRGEQ